MVKDYLVVQVMLGIQNAHLYHSLIISSKKDRLTNLSTPGSSKPLASSSPCRSMRYQTNSKHGMRSERTMENSGPGPLVSDAALSAAFPQHPPV